MNGTWLPGGPSSGFVVELCAMHVEFSLGTDTKGSVRVPTSYCGVLGFCPSYGTILTVGVIPLVQSFDTVGWFARDPTTFKRVDMYF